MSIHSSLRVKSGGGEASRNVLKRHERVRLMKDQGRWKDERSVFGLPKIKQAKVKAAKKASGKDAAEKGAEGAKPAAAAPAAGGKAAGKSAAKS